jgi:Transglycosylase SLT domain
LEDSVGRLGSKKEQMEAMIARLRAAERAGAFTRPPASDSGGESVETREGELETQAKTSWRARWTRFAAMGKAESGHGANIGPSSAGALGPMQFLPSTWREYGVDGNGDRVANIMDPVDAIPAAAKYLEASGALEDWYAALYTYKRAGWCVREVLGIAEAYRRQVDDDAVEPYV